MLHVDAVEPRLTALLRALAEEDALREMRLVGGTALALQLGHRASVDLDFCGPRLNGSIEALRERLARHGDVAVLAEGKALHTYAIDGIKLDIVVSASPWLADAVVEGRIRLAGPLDIAAMKLLAITNRGARKDFVDLAFLLDILTLSAMLDAHDRKYRTESRFAVLKSLVYFDAAAAEPMPPMLRPVDWTAIRRKVESAVRPWV